MGNKEPALKRFSALPLLAFACTIQTAQAKPTVQVAQSRQVRAATPLDLSTPQKTVESFIAAFNAHDLQQAARCVLWAQPSSKGRAEMQQDSAKNNEVFSLRGLRVEAAGEDATVRMMATFSDKNSAPPPRNGIQGEFSQMRLRHEKEGWKIVPDYSNEISSALGIHNFLLYRATQIAYAQTPEKSEPRMARMREILLAAVQYLVESNQMFTGYEPQPFEESIKSFAKLDRFDFVDAKGRKVAFAFNDQLRNTSAKSLSNPENTVMFYEVGDQKTFFDAGQNTRLSFPPGGAIVGFVDGHIELVDAQQAASLEWK